jgi:hypothetical protein
VFALPRVVLYCVVLYVLSCLACFLPCICVVSFYIGRPHVMSLFQIKSVYDSQKSVPIEVKLEVSVLVLFCVMLLGLWLGFGLGLCRLVIVLWRPCLVIPYSFDCLFLWLSCLVIAKDCGCDDLIFVLRLALPFLAQPCLVPSRIV